MHSARWAIVGAALAATLATAPDARATAPVRDSFHLDHRATPRLQLDPSWQARAGQTGEATARAFLAQRADDYGLPATLSNLRLVRVRESLLGTHHVFQQQIAGIDVRHAEIIVSVTNADGRVYRVFNNTYPSKNEAALPRSATLDEATAFDTAWARLRAHGELLSTPRANLVWIPEGQSFRLSWIVDLELSAPYGGWEVILDATTGEVRSTRDARIYRLEDEFTRTPVSKRVNSYTGPIADRRAAFAAREAADDSQASAPGRAVANGTGVVFDPDPRATLMNDNLQDGSPASAFTAAYFTRDLLDITLNGSTYSLTGPYCNIINFDPPSTPPSTTSDGNWTATRGNNAFNDAMTYFQIDQNNRYMRSLGFTGASAIQDGPIGTDTDGVNGADNSYYQPGANRMAFGHGCVDDSEDVDVMLHEYGHAINHDINSSWGGGDMGAIGEGFGDYWCGSYSYSTPNGPIYHPEWAFSWDGHGTGNQCWPGRIMNAFGARYVHTTFYGAHQGIPGGYQSDELWSTPIFQALLELVAQGQTREDADTIILESQFGLGGGLKMRDMAKAIIQTAGLLFPTGPHADIYIQKFLVHEIVNIPVVSLAVADDATILSGGPNGVADPGETVTFELDVINEGTLGAFSVFGEVTSSTPGVVIIQGTSKYSDLPPGASSANDLPFSISIPAGHPCGDPVVLSLYVTYSDGSAQATTLGAQMGTGVPQGASASVSPGLAIPDNNSTGIQSTITISGTAALITSNLNIDINITHTYIGDLIVRLISPVGTSVTLHNRSGGSADNIIGNYPGTLTPSQSLAAFVGDPLDGDWILRVSDHAGIDTGTLNSWGINDVSGYDCETGATDVTLVAGAPTAFELAPANPNPFASSTSIRFAVPGEGARVSLRIYDVTGRQVRVLTDGFLPAGQHSATWDGRSDLGARVGSGIYFYQLEGDGFRSTRKVVHLN